MDDARPSSGYQVVDTGFSNQEVRFMNEIHDTTPATEPIVIPGDAQAPQDPVVLTPEQAAHQLRMARLTLANLNQAEAKRQRRQARNLLVQPRVA